MDHLVSAFWESMEISVWSPGTHIKNKPNQPIKKLITNCQQTGSLATSVFSPCARESEGRGLWLCCSTSLSHIVQRSIQWDTCLKTLDESLVFKQDTQCCPLGATHNGCACTLIRTHVYVWTYWERKFSKCGMVMWNWEDYFISEQNKKYGVTSNCFLSHTQKPFKLTLGAF